MLQLQSCNTAFIRLHAGGIRKLPTCPSIFSFRTLRDKLPIHIIANNGQVTLTGVVDSQADQKYGHDARIGGWFKLWFHRK